MVLLSDYREKLGSSATVCGHSRSAEPFEEFAVCLGGVSAASYPARLLLFVVIADASIAPPRSRDLEPRPEARTGTG